MAKFQTYTLSHLQERLEKIASKNRHDQVSRNIHEVFAKRAKANPDALVTSEDIKQTYSTFASFNRESNFKDYFPEIFATANEEKQINTSMFSRDESMNNGERALSPELPTYEEDAIKSSSLERLKKVVEASVDFPEYHYLGFSKVKNMGNSGFANWTVAFNTGNGTASINVPVIVVDGYANVPEKFVTESGALKRFNAEEITSYAKSYVGREKRAFQKSGLEKLGAQVTVAQAYPEETTDGTENHNISMNFSVPMDAQFNAKFDSSQAALLNAIDAARAEALSKIEGGNGDGTMSLSFQINYSGSLDFCDEEAVPTPEHPLTGEIIPEGGPAPAGDPVIENVEVYPISEYPQEDFDGVITFNASRKVRGGTRVATIMVRVANGEASANSFYGDGAVHELTGENLNNFLDKEVTAEAAEDDGTEAFSNAFLVDASLNELRKELKASVDSGNIARATSCIRIISSKFSPEATSRAMSDFIAWNKGTKSSLTWDEDNDPNYADYLKTSDIHFSK